MIFYAIRIVFSILFFFFNFIFVFYCTGYNGAGMFPAGCDNGRVIFSSLFFLKSFFIFSSHSTFKSSIGSCSYPFITLRTGTVYVTNVASKCWNRVAGKSVKRLVYVGKCLAFFCHNFHYLSMSSKTNVT